MNKVKEIRNEFKKIEKANEAIFDAYCSLGRSLDTISTLLDGADLSDRSDRSDKRGKGARMRKIEEPERLPDVPDWRDGAARQEADDRLTRIRLTVAAHQGDGLAEIIEAILADGTDLKTLASILGVNRARISEAKHGHARPGFVARFAEVLGCDGGAGSANNGTNGAYEANGQERGRRGMANCRGKRGAK